MNLRPSGYEPDELPDCSTPRQLSVVGGGASAGEREERETDRRKAAPPPRCSDTRYLMTDHWSGGDLLSHALRRSTIGATGLNGRVRDGIGCFPRAVTTRPGKEMRGISFPGLIFALTAPPPDPTSPPIHRSCPGVPSVDGWGGGVGWRSAESVSFRYRRKTNQA